MAHDEKPDPYSWIKTSSREVANEARDVLNEVLRQMELLAERIVVMSHGPTRIPLQVVERGDLIQRRARVVVMFEARRILRHVVPHGNGFLAEADEATVRHANMLLQARLCGAPQSSSGHSILPPRSSLPPNMQAVLPPEPLLDLTWITTCARDVAGQAHDILREVLAELDLLHVPQVISPYTRGTDDMKLTFDLPHSLRHDLRGSRARHISRAGVPEKVIMDVQGRKTGAIFDRYSITSSRDLADANERAEKPRSGSIPSQNPKTATDGCGEQSV